MSDDDMASYPHMCRSDHFEVGFAESKTDELCPVCEARGAHLNDLLCLDSLVWSLPNMSASEIRKIIKNKIADLTMKYYEQ